MKQKIVIAILCLFAVFKPHAAEAQYKYANIDGEYLISLPDAPLGETIWAQDGNVPIISDPPKYGAVGEYGLVRRIDPDTDDIFEVRITFVRANRDFLLNLEREEIEEYLKQLFIDVRMQKEKFSMSQGTGTLKWGTYGGYSISPNNDLLYNVAHYLVGEESIQIVKIVHSTQNPEFAKYYKELSKSITFMGR